LEDWNVEVFAEIPLRREKIGRLEKWKDGTPIAIEGIIGGKIGKFNPDN